MPLKEIFIPVVKLVGAGLGYLSSSRIVLSWLQAVTDASMPVAGWRELMLQSTWPSV